MTQTVVYTVPDMTCDHCRHAVTREVSVVEGVRSVDVDLETKRVTVTGDDLSDQSVRAAIETAVAERAELVGRLRRIETRVQLVEQLVEADRPCVEVLAAIAAANAALDRLAVELVVAHTDRCAAEALASGDAETAALKSEELLDAVQRFARTH